MTKLAGLLIVLSCVLRVPLAAQCFGDDLFTPPAPLICCNTAFPSLPPFPGASLSGRGACILNGGLESTWSASASLSPPIMIFPDLYVCQITFASPQTPTLTSLVVMKYARTWTETWSGGTRQVWRFLVNTDITYNPVGAGASPCPVPPCSGIAQNAPRPVLFIGGIDYAQNCTSNAWSVAYTLTHFCGVFMHSSSSTRPLSTPFDHTERSYAFAGPAPFNFGPNTSIGGLCAGDSQRSTDIDLNASPILWNCKVEEAILGSLQGEIPAFCPCAAAPNTNGPQWSNILVGFTLFCPGTVSQGLLSVNFPPTLPSGLGVLHLGAFAGAAGTFPGTREVNSYLGLATAPDPCPALGFTLPFHIVTGVSHHGGDIGTTFPNASGTIVSTDRFMDLENMLIPVVGAPGGTTIGIGSLFVSSQSWGICLF